MGDFTCLQAVEKFVHSAHQLKSKLVNEGHVFTQVEAEIRLHPLSSINVDNVISRLEYEGWKKESHLFLADRVCTSGVRHRVVYGEDGSYIKSEIVSKSRVGRADKWKLGRLWGALASVSIEEPTNISSNATKHVRLIDRFRLVSSTCSMVVVDVSLTQMGPNYETTLQKRQSLEVEIEANVDQSTVLVSVRACVGGILDLFM
jgi:hypothetical protein